MQIADIIVSERFRHDNGDIEKLAQSIEEVGLMHPVVVSEERVLIAGKRRLEAFKHLGRAEIPAYVISLKDIRKGELHENTLRKSFTVSEMVAIKRALEPEFKVDAEGRRLANLKKGDKGPEVQNLHHGEMGKTRDNIARYTGISHETMKKAEAIVKAAEESPELYGGILSKVDDGVLSIDKGFKLVQIKEKQQEIKRTGSPTLPEGVFGVLYADPPWRFAYGGSVRGVADVYYPTMELNDILALPIQPHIADSALLFLWTPNSFLEDALRVMGAWGFMYMTNIVWVKDRFGTGFWVRNRHELLLIGVKGDFHCPADEDRCDSVIEAASAEHSAKPEEAYTVVERMTPGRKRLELFARSHRDGWTSWGNEII